MTDGAHPKRTYHSTRRQTQAQQTRQQIADAARKLFLQYGYIGATFEAIAHEAAVAPATVYAIFGSKLKLLSHLLNISIGGQDSPMSPLERRDAMEIFQTTDQHLQIEMIAHKSVAILERTAPVLEIMRIAAKTEPEIAELLHQMLDQRWQNMAVVMQQVMAQGPLREGMDVAQATDTLWSLMSPEMFLLLTADRGWSYERYSQWMANSLIRLLLP